MTNWKRWWFAEMTKKLKSEFECITKARNLLIEQKKGIRFGDWNATEIEFLNDYLFITAKPNVYLVNMSEKDFFRKKNKWLSKIKTWVDENDPEAVMIPFSADFESRFVEMASDEEREACLKENPGCSSMLDRIIKAGYKALQLIYFFTAGNDEVKAWTIQQNTSAPQAAGRIHTDMERGFIMAEVMAYEDFKFEGSENNCKAAGKYRQKGRDYIVQDGDIIFFKFNSGAGLKDKKK